MLMGGCIPKEWRKSSRKSSISAHGRKQERVGKLPTSKNVVCKLFIMVLRAIINGCVEESGMIGDIQGGFRVGRRAEDNPFLLERMIEMVKVQKECLFVDFFDMEKAYYIVNRKKLFEVMRGYAVH